MLVIILIQRGLCGGKKSTQLKVQIYLQKLAIVMLGQIYHMMAYPFLRKIEEPGFMIPHLMVVILNYSRLQV